MSDDVRGFDAALDVALPDRPGPDLAVRCFAAADAHRRGDHRPSASVNVDSGAWCCHGCGAQGGAYDAALELGLHPAAAMELLERHGLTDDDKARHSTRHPQTKTKPAPLPSEEQLRDWEARLLGSEPLLARLRELRGWSRATLETLGLGWDGERLVFPVRDAGGQLVTVARYLPGAGRGGAELLALSGRRR